MNYKQNLCKLILFLIIIYLFYFIYTYDYHNSHDLLEYSLDFRRDGFNDIYINRYDIGYSAMVYLLSNLISFELFFSLIVTVLLILKILNYRYKITFLIIYILTYFNNFELNHLKAAIASTLILLSFNTKKYNIFILFCASLMHFSATLFLIIYLIYYLQKKIILPFILLILFYLFYNTDVILLRLSKYINFGEFNLSFRIIFLISALMLLRNKFSTAKYKIYILVPSIFYFILSPFFLTISQRIIFLVLPIILSCLIVKLYENECKILDKFFIILLISSELYNFYFLK